jgi:hypothetical protein
VLIRYAKRWWCRRRRRRRRKGVWELHEPVFDHASTMGFIVGIRHQTY